MKTTSQNKLYASLVINCIFVLVSIAMLVYTFSVQNFEFKTAFLIVFIVFIINFGIRSIFNLRSIRK